MKLKIILDSQKEYIVDLSNAVYKSLDNVVHDLMQEDVYTIPINGIHVAIIVKHISSIEQLV